MCTQAIQIQQEKGAEDPFLVEQRKKIQDKLDSLQAAQPATTGGSNAQSATVFIPSTAAQPSSTAKQGMPKHQLVHELLIDANFRLEARTDMSFGNAGATSIQQIMSKAFWDSMVCLHALQLIFRMLPASSCSHDA